MYVSLYMCYTNISTIEANVDVERNDDYDVGDRQMTMMMLISTRNYFFSVLVLLISFGILYDF